MQKLKTVRNSFKAFIADELMIKKIISFEELKELAKEYGTKESVAERRLRNGEEWDLPVVKLNAKKKPIQGSEAIAYYRWIGTRNVMKK